MAHREACELLIEQEIKEGLAQGKTPYSIGKDLSAWVEKLFEAQIPANTLIRRAERMQEKITTNVVNHPTPQNPSQIPVKQEKQPVTSPNPAQTPGPGRSPKYAKPTVQTPANLEERLISGSQAIYLANIAISQLSRIELDDPKRGEAFQRVIDWIKKQPGERKL